MGNLEENGFVLDAPLRAQNIIHRTFSDKSWIEGAALTQLEAMARLPGVDKIVAFPDLHPGKYGATGVALRARTLHPLLIGNDIGCGMSLFVLDLPLRKFKLDKAVSRLRQFDMTTTRDAADRLESIGLSGDLFADSLGTIGGGNHFCELQAVETLFSATQTGIDGQSLYLLVHSGSRGFGAQVFSHMMARVPNLVDGLAPHSSEAVEWLANHDQCVAWASLNRLLIAEKAGEAFHADVHLLADIPHNLVVKTQRGHVHYKGAAMVGPGGLAPLAGSRATLSYVLRATDQVEGSLGGISHGAGRKYDRGTMHGRVGRNRSERDELLRNDWGGIAICDDRNLVIEEAPSAYKDAGKVLEDLEAAGLVERLAAMRPLVTYKKAVPADSDEKHRGGKPAHAQKGRQIHGRN